MTRFSVLLLAPLSLTLACNLGGKPIGDSGSNSGDSSSTDDTGSSNNGTTIADIRTGVVPLDVPYTLEHLIVTSPHSSNDKFLFVQDAGGGPNSGMALYDKSLMADIFAVPGDEVTVVGTPSDYYGWTEFTEDSVTITGSGTVPPAIDLGDGTTVTDWDPYESVLITLSNQAVTAVDSYNTGMLSPASSTSTSGVALNNGFYDATVECGGTYPSITGILFFEYSAYTINPRDATDMTDPVLGAVQPATCSDVQLGICGAVALTDVVVTSDSWTKNGDEFFFVQDNGGGENSGLLIDIVGGTYAVTVGDTVSMTGATTEAYGLTEVLISDTSTMATTGTATPVATEITSVPTDFEPYEDCLVTLDSVDVTSDPSAYGDVTTSWGVNVDDLFYSFTAANGDHYNTVTGPLYYAYSTWYVEPRSASDLN